MSSKYVKITGVMLMAIWAATAKLRSEAVHDEKLQVRLLKPNQTDLETTSAEIEEDTEILVQAGSSQARITVSNTAETTIFFGYQYCNETSTTNTRAVKADQTIVLPASYFMTVFNDSDGEKVTQGSNNDDHAAHISPQVSSYYFLNVGGIVKKNIVRAGIIHSSIHPQVFISTCSTEMMPCYYHNQLRA